MFDVVVARGGRDDDGALVRLHRLLALRVQVVSDDLRALMSQDPAARCQEAKLVVFRATDALGRLSRCDVETLGRFHAMHPRTLLLAGVGARPGATCSVADRVALLDAGADDVVGLDVNAIEYTARLRALLRRWERCTRQAPVLIAGVRPRLDPQLRSLLGPWGAQPLTAKECLVMAAILEAAPVATRAAIGQRLWTDGWYGTPKAIDMHVANLRRKLRLVSGDEWRIETIRGSGFLLVDASAACALGA